MLFRHPYSTGKKNKKKKKTVGPSQILSFAGVELASCLMEARLPLDKFEKCIAIGHVRYINIQAWLRGFRVKIAKFSSFLSLNSQRRLRYKENNTKYRSLTWKPRSHVRILIYRTWPILSDFLKRKRVTLKEVQSLNGLLNFACSVIVPGRAFLRRLIDLTIGVRSPKFSIRLTRSVKEDLNVWLSFLAQYNRKSLFLPCLEQFWQA